VNEFKSLGQKHKSMLYNMSGANVCIIIFMLMHC